MNKNQVGAQSESGGASVKFGRVRNQNQVRGPQLGLCEDSESGGG